MEGAIQFTIWGVVGSAATAIVVQLLKRVFGEEVIQGRVAVIVAVATAIILSVLAHLAAQIPAVGEWLDVIGAGLFAAASVLEIAGMGVTSGMGSAAVYSVVKKR